MKNEPLISALEPRLLFDGAAVATAVEVLDNNSFENSETNENVEAKSVEKKQIAFIDESVKDKDTLIEGLDENTEVFIIDNDSNGLKQISQILKNKDSIDTIHVFSHGKIGEITLGNTTINNENIDSFSNEFSQIENSLNINADILLYGCSVSANGQGKDFVDKISSLTNADVAASTDLTGASSLGGDWDLEYKVGQIESEVLSFENYDETFANAAPVISTSTTTTDITTGLPSSAYSNSNARFAFDDDTGTSYFNDNGAGSSFTIDSQAYYIINSLTVTSGGNRDNDPTSYAIYASNDKNNITTLISSGSLTPPAGSLTDYPTINFSNTEAYRYYRLAFNSVATIGADILVSEIRIGGEKIENSFYTEDSPAGNIVSNLTLSDSDNANMSSATVSISDGFTAGDILSFTNNDGTLYGSISALYDSANGILTLSGSGTVAQYENALKAVQYSSSSDNPTLTNSLRKISWQANDGTDNSNTSTSFIEVTAQNDNVNISIGDVTGNITEGGTLTDSGSITFTDADVNDRPTATEVTKTITALAQDGVTPLILNSTQNGIIADAFSITNVSGNTNNGTVTWNYSITEAQLDFLGQGETVTATFTIEVSDGNGSSAFQDVTITLTGTNDAPVFTPIDVDGVITDGGVIIDNGSANFGDTDLTDRPSATESLVSIDALRSDGTTSFTLTSAQQTAIENAFSITNLVSNTNNGVVNWTYSIAQSDIRFLAVGEKVTAVFRLTVTDDEGQTDTQDVTIVINGGNDAPEIQIVDVDGSVAEEGTLNDSGSITFTDIDTDNRPVGSSATKSISATAQGGGTLTLTSAQEAVIASAFSITNQAGNTNNGTVTWDYTITENQLDFLGEGEVITAVFTITVTDDNAGSTTQDVTITLTGKNDAPDLQVVDNTGVITEGTTISDSGSLSYTDVDYTDRVSVSQVMKSISALEQDGITALTLTTAQQNDLINAFSSAVASGSTNNGTVTWAYSILESQLDFLGQGETVSLVFSVTVTDDEGQVSSQDVTVTVNGTNDSPDIQVVDAIGNISEGASLNDSGSVTFTDVDLTDRPTASESINTITAYRKDGITTFTLTAEQQAAIENGFSISELLSNTNDGTINWAYSISESDLDFLGESETIQAVFTIRVTDDEGATHDQDVTINIGGQNDDPVASSENIDVILTLAEGYTKDISTQFSDIDNSDILTYEVIGLPKGMTYDSVTGIITGNGEEIGVFIITLNVYDSSSLKAVATKDYEMVILGPPKVEVPVYEPVEPFEPPVETTPVEVVPVVEDEIAGVINEEIETHEELKQSELNVDNVGKGHIEYESIPIDGFTTNNDKNLLKNIDIIFDPRSTTDISEPQEEAYNILGMSIESVSLNDTFLELKITDIKVKQTYEVSLANGEPLPASIVFDEKTGFIKGNIFDDLELTIKAIGEDGKIRILNIKIDISALKDEELQISSNDKTIGIQEQLASQNNKMQTYGSNLSSLFDDV